jgi:hypothetical protein
MHIVIHVLNDFDLIPLLVVSALLAIVCSYDRMYLIDYFA